MKGRTMAIVIDLKKNGTSLAADSPTVAQL